MASFCDAEKPAAVRTYQAMQNYNRKPPVLDRKPRLLIGFHLTTDPPFCSVDLADLTTYMISPALDFGSDSPSTQIQVRLDKAGE